MPYVLSQRIEKTVNTKTYFNKVIKIFVKKSADLSDKKFLMRSLENLDSFSEDREVLITKRAYLESEVHDRIKNRQGFAKTMFVGEIYLLAVLHDLFSAENPLYTSCPKVRRIHNRPKLAYHNLYLKDMVPYEEDYNFIKDHWGNRYYTQICSEALIWAKEKFFSGEWEDKLKKRKGYKLSQKPSRYYCGEDIRQYCLGQNISFSALGRAATHEYLKYLRENDLVGI